MKRKFQLVLVTLFVVLSAFCVLFACDEPEVANYTVTYDANGGTGIMQPITMPANEEKVLDGNIFTRENYKFEGWATSSDGEVEFQDKSAIKVVGDMTLYAVWKRSAYKVNFIANGGNGEMSTQVMPINQQNALKNNTYFKQDFYFAGWATSSNGQINYADGASITLESDIDLYAIWTANPSSATVSAKQKGDEQKISVAWSQTFDNVEKVEVRAIHNNELISSKVFTDSKDIAAGSAELDVYWGKFDVSVILFEKDGAAFADYKQSVEISTDSYNIAFMYGTFPVSIFTLQMMDKDSADIDSNAETFVHLSGRYRAYDWENLPDNMKPVPVAMPGSDGIEPLNNTKAWIKELYDMNNDAHFTLYFTDIYVGLLCDFFVDNGIPVKNWNAIMYSDGTATAMTIVRLYDVANPAEKYNEMVTAWNKYLSNPALGRYSLPYGESENLPGYSYVLCNEMENVKWYTGRLRTTENVILQNTEFANTVVNGSKNTGRKEFYLNNLLDALTAEEKSTFKVLYSIEESTFKVATDANKKVMMILGTSWGGEGAELEDYLRITMEVYGDDYVYYYKGHPGYPTSAYPARQAILNRLKDEGYALYELDNSVAAEFFLFFFDNIEMIGYSSTTFESGKDENADGVFGKDMASEYYSELLETYISKIEDVASFNEQNADKNILLDVNGNYYLVEFQKSMAIDKAIAIYDANSKVISYYKLNDGKYQLLS